MKLLFLPCCVALLTYPLVACKIVFDDEKPVVIPPGPEGDTERNEARLNETFEQLLIPLITSSALTVESLESAVSDDLDVAGQKMGNRGSGMGAAWNFSVHDSGEVIEARLDTGARTLGVDVDGDAQTDITVQLGPVIRGTALRDVAPFYNFDDFRDQIEFAKLSRAINDRIKPTLTVPDGALVGRQVSFTGVVPLKKLTDKLLLTPITVEFTDE